MANIYTYKSNIDIFLYIMICLMEKKNKITTHLDEMIDLINGFYDDEHISESGTIYRI